MEFCLALPPEQKLQQGWPRFVLRKAMKNILPEEIRWRVGKSNLGANFDRSLLVFERDLLEEMLLKNSKAIEEYVDISFLQESFQKGVANAVWPAAILAIWLRQTQLAP